MTLLQYDEVFHTRSAIQVHLLQNAIYNNQYAYDAQGYSIITSEYWFLSS